jgi:hypothetical protein
VQTFSVKLVRCLSTRHIGVSSLEATSTLGHSHSSRCAETRRSKRTGGTASGIRTWQPRYGQPNTGQTVTQAHLETRDNMEYALLTFPCWRLSQTFSISKLSDGISDEALSGILKENLLKSSGSIYGKHSVRTSVLTPQVLQRLREIPTCTFTNRLPLSSARFPIYQCSPALHCLDRVFPSQTGRDTGIRCLRTGQRRHRVHLVTLRVELCAMERRRVLGTTKAPLSQLLIRVPTRGARSRWFQSHLFLESLRFYFNVVE